MSWKGQGSIVHLLIFQLQRKRNVRPLSLILLLIAFRVRVDGRNDGGTHSESYQCRWFRVSADGTERPDIPLALEL